MSGRQHCCEAHYQRPHTAARPTWGHLRQLPSGCPPIFCPILCLLLLTLQPLIALFPFCSDGLCFHILHAVSPREAWAELYYYFCESTCQDARVVSWHLPPPKKKVPTHFPHLI